MPDSPGVGLFLSLTKDACGAPADRRPTKVSDSAPQKVQHDLIKFFV